MTEYSFMANEDDAGVQFYRDDNPVHATTIVSDLNYSGNRVEVLEQKLFDALCLLREVIKVAKVVSDD